MYAIVDIETTGGYAYGNRIIEIAIFLFDGKKITDKYQSLIDPGYYIPPYITSLTGITNEMVEDAPNFEQVADEVYEFTKDHIFVAHNANFDYSFVKQEFESLGGYEFKPKKLCTVRLSRKIFPGLPSYSLGNLCGSLGINIKNRHRAEGDAKATVQLMKLLIKNDKDNFIEKSLKGNSRETLLPANLPKEQFDALPEAAGVYYFHDEKGKVIYVGKAGNIKKRVISHFSGKNRTFQSQNFMNEIHSISHEECGNELVALLLESHEIKRLWPKFNWSQKRAETNVGIYKYEDMQGYARFAINKITKFNVPLMSFRNETEARNFLSVKVRENKVCPRLSGLQKVNCEGFCEGACSGKEEVENYNLKVELTIQSFQSPDNSFAIIGKGRDKDESSVVLVEKGIYKGFGFVNSDSPLYDLNDFREYIQPYKDNQDVQKILDSHLRNNPKEKLVKFVIPTDTGLAQISL